MIERCQVLVLGAGPAGLAAAAAVAQRGAAVTLLDVQPRAGGQVWRHDVARQLPARARRALRAAQPVRQHFGMRVVAASTTGRTLLAEDAEGAHSFHWEQLVLATGARELWLPFPGWTLPGVTGAGGLQALAKQGWPLAGRRVVVAGSGPLLLAAAASLRTHGAQVLAIVEQAARADVHAFARSLWRWPAKLAQAAQLRVQLLGVPIHYGAVVRAALGDGALRAVAIDDGKAVRELPCDLLASGFGLVPEVALARQLGCDLAGGTHAAIRVDALQRTSVDHILAAGECCGIGGEGAARLEGAIAGCAVAGDLAAARRLCAARDRMRRFAAGVAHTFAPGPRARALADDATVVCRCEDVTLGALRGCDGARSAKLATRCGMGPCQGRVCGAAMAEIAGWGWHGQPRWPVFPARLETLAADFPATRSCA